MRSFSLPTFSKEDYRALLPWVVGGIILLLICIGVFVLIVLGKTRRSSQMASVPSVDSAVTTTASMLVPRHLDGVLVSPEQANLAPWAIMIDNQLDARPQAGLSAASVVIESPVEGGITRLMALFAPTSTLPEIGPVLSARPYFVDWAFAWNATYFHVGGSPEALEQIKNLGARFRGVSEIANGWAFWRAANRTAPHDVITNGERMQMLAERKGYTSSTVSAAWHFLDVATGTASSTKIGEVTRAAIAYGGSYSVSWRFDKARDVYTRFVSGRAVKDAQGNSVEADNVLVIKTDAQVLDEKGRLRLRTTGSGDAVAYRDGNKYSLRWRRSPGEMIRFEGEGGVEFLLRPGKTWIQVTTDDASFAGLEK
jgi:hypothetical protein